MLKLFTNNKNQLPNKIKKIQAGDKELRNTFISDYTPFIIDKISKTTGRYVDVNNSDELSVGLKAFDEAIDKYNETKGAFLSFATLIIRNRVIDYLRKENKHNVVDPIDENYEITSKDDFVYNIILRDQITILKERLREFDITFDSLVKNSPKHKDTRQNIIRVANGVVKTPVILKEFYLKNRLPRNAISKKFNISIKSINSNRQYLITCIVVIDSELKEIKQYLVGKAGVTYDK